MEAMRESLDASFDEYSENIDLNSVIATFPEGDEHPNDVPVKKLSTVFESCLQQDAIESGKAIDASDGMKVFLRIRPSDTNLTGTIRVESENSIVTTAPETSKRAQYTKTEERHYVFSRVFGAQSTQLDIFDTSVEPLLNRFMQGESCVLFAYGMTNAGKTYTIQGTPQNPGLLPRLVSQLFERMEHEKQTKWDLQVSMLEIYQEKIYDLLSKNSKKDKLNIRDGNGRVEVCKLSSHTISSAQDALKLMNDASGRRTKSKTSLNASSSRSHAVYSLSLTKVMKGKKQSVVFQVVDLAGAERHNRTNANAEQQKEANIINMSLMQLWRCLQGMKKRATDININIPFRESKLTHLLMPLISQAGLNGVAMIACVNPQIEDYDETISILGNASLACKIKEIIDIGRVGSTAPCAISPVPVTTTVQLPKKKVDAPPAIPVIQTKTSSMRESIRNNGAGNSTKQSTVRPSNSTAELRTSVEDAMDIEVVAPVVEVEMDESITNELNELREELDKLKQENHELLVQQFSRETEIRTQVAQEMAERSSHLLSQIQDLQEQLYSKANQIDDVTKSCKKAKKRHIAKANEATAKDLAEAEEELERVKVEYENDIMRLRKENEVVRSEVEYWKKKYEMATEKMAELESDLDSVKESNAKFAIPATVTLDPTVNDGVVYKCAIDYSYREETVVSPKSSRSPLGIVKQDSNSPVVNGKAAGSKRKSNEITKSTSPLNKNVQSLNGSLNLHILNDENDEAAAKKSNNNSGNYLRKLRSHFVRA